MLGAIVSVCRLRKLYGATVALDEVSFEARRGEVLALLGPNGSGKTSTLEVLEGLRRADGGSLSIDGIDPARQPRKLWSRIGVQLQTSALPSFEILWILPSGEPPAKRLPSASTASA